MARDCPRHCRSPARKQRHRQRPRAKCFPPGHPRAKSSHPMAGAYPRPETLWHFTLATHFSLSDHCRGDLHPAAVANLCGGKDCRAVRKNQGDLGRHAFRGHPTPAQCLHHDGRNPHCGFHPGVSHRTIPQQLHRQKLHGVSGHHHYLGRVPSGGRGGKLPRRGAFKRRHRAARTVHSAGHAGDAHLHRSDRQPDRAGDNWRERQRPHRRARRGRHRNLNGRRRHCRKLHRHI